MTTETAELKLTTVPAPKRSYYKGIVVLESPEIRSHER
jgi:hypothetical protein